MSHQTTAPSDAELLAAFDDCISKLEYHYRDTRAGVEMTQARTAVAALIARNAELEAERDALAAKVGMRDTTIRKWWKIADEFEAIADALAAENKALRRAFPKPRNRCCMNCAEHGSCNPDGLNGCAYDDSGEDYDRGWNDCLDAALARTPANGDAA